jgi:hypothetical protein
LAREFQITEYTPILLGNAVTTTWQGVVSISTRNNTVIWTNPDNTEAEELFSWFKQMQAQQE